jgi:hypothetical protein
MKSLVPPCTLVLLAACAPGGLTFDPLSALPGQTSGVALDGERARIGMADQICDVDVRTAVVGADYQAADGREHVLATSGEQVIGGVDARMFHGEGGAFTFYAGEPLGADFRTDGGPVALLADDAGCRVVFGDEALALDGVSCAGAPGFAYDRASDAVWIADGTTVARIASDGAVVSWSVDADEVVWTGSHVVLGRLGDREVTAVDADGTSLWTHGLDGTLAGLSADATTGDVAVMIDEGARGATLQIVDGTGLVQADLPLPSVADVTLGDAVLALQTPDAVLFYGVGGHRSPYDTSGLSAPVEASSVGVESTVGVAGVFLATALIVD